jgi:hypothetical protein
MKLKMRTKQEWEDMKKAEANNENEEEVSEDDIMKQIDEAVMKQKLEKQEQNRPIETKTSLVVEKPRTQNVKPVFETINEKALEFKMDMKQVQDFAVANYSGENLFTAGFQVCLIMVNQRLQVENLQRNYLKGILDGNIEVPFDPRQPTVLSRVVTSLSIRELK